MRNFNFRCNLEEIDKIIEEDNCTQEHPVVQSVQPISAVEEEAKQSPVKLSDIDIKETDQSE